MEWAVKRVATYANLSEKTIYNLVYSKKIPFHRISEKKVVFYKKEIDEWLKDRKKQKKLRSALKKRMLCKEDRKDFLSNREEKKRWEISYLLTRFPKKYLTFFITIIFCFFMGWVGSSIFYGSRSARKEYLFGPLEKATNLESLIHRAQIGGIHINQSLLEKDKVDIKIDYISNIEAKGEIKSPITLSFLINILRAEQENYAVTSKVIDILKPRLLDDPEIREALIEKIYTDNNPVIRMKVVTTLSEQAKIRETKEALIKVLRNDENEAVRFRALCSLEEVMDEKIISELTNIKKEEGSKNIRTRIESILRKHA